MAWSICSRLGGTPAAFMPCSACARVRALVKVRLSSPSSRAASRSASRRALSCAAFSALSRLSSVLTSMDNAKMQAAMHTARKVIRWRIE